MRHQNLDLTIAEVLSDPVIGAAMRADHVDPPGFRDLAPIDRATARRKPPRRSSLRLDRQPIAVFVRANEAVVVGFFTQRPIFASAVAIILVMAGAICYVLLRSRSSPTSRRPRSW